ncbi:ApbE family protein [uncultured archaeon]|nr:ApbE family protein [uncultured archaeon]
MEITARSEQVLGTHVEIKLPAAHSSFFPLCFSELGRIEQAFSRFLPASELSCLNSHLGVWQDASAELVSLVSRAEEFRILTDGHFDISLKSRLDALGYDKDYSFAPKQAASPPSPVSTSPSFQLDKSSNRILLNKEIEFGGLGKGYAADKVGEILQKSGVTHYYINAGGDINAKQVEGCEPWTILLEHPDDAERAIGTLELDGAIAGSAPNRRRWGEKGQLHHLLNAKTGMPAQGVKAIFVIAKTGIEADAYATAIFTAGFEEGIELSQKLPVEMLFISSKDEMYQSRGFDAEIFD